MLDDNCTNETEKLWIKFECEIKILFNDPIFLMKIFLFASSFLYLIQICIYIRYMYKDLSD